MRYLLLLLLIPLLDSCSLHIEKTSPPVFHSSSSFLPAQPEFSGLKVIVKDEYDTPMPFANVVLLKADGTMISGGQTNDDGVLFFRGIPPDESYCVKVSYIAYKPFVSQVFTLSSTGVFCQIYMRDIVHEFYGCPVFTRPMREPFSPQNTTLYFEKFPRIKDIQ